jgi:hypothetical protein
MKNKFISALWCSAILAGLASSAQAQWQTQSILIKPGWTAVYLNVDASYKTLDNLVGGDVNNPIQEVWLWNVSGSTLQYVTSPQTPLTSSSQWAVWGRIGTGVTSTLTTLVPNAAFLVFSTATNNYTWKVQGQPVAPSYTWTSTGENLIGFSTVTNNPPAFDTFLSLAPSLEAAVENGGGIYQYTGGPLSSSNPSQIFALHATTVTRGQAFWIQSPSYQNNYFGPFTAVISSTGGVAFSNATSQFSFHLQNTTAGNVTVTLKLQASETPPLGQTPIVAVPPLMVRGTLNTINLTYNYTNLPVGTSISWTLAPQGTTGSDIVVVLGLNRYSMNASPGSLYAGILKFTDSFGYTEVDAPVSAQVSTYTGLWMGSASVNQVGQYLKTYQMTSNNTPAIGSNGAYIVTSITTNLGAVESPFPLRLIVHNDGVNVNLLQRVFYGNNVNSNTIVALNESSLDPAQLSTARRISAVHLPWSATNAPFPMTGTLAPGGTLTANATFQYDDQSSNPFLHSYHPDHDNLDATYQHELPIGSESYGIQRQITLSISPPGNDFASLTQAGQSFAGIYQETITMTGIAGAQRTFNTAGTFGLTRLSSIAVLNP